SLSPIFSFSALAASASSLACSSIGSTAARANEPHESSRNKTRHLRLASVHVLAPAARHAANDLRALARDARRSPAQLRPSRAGIARHRYLRRLLPPCRTTHSRKKIEVDSLDRRRRRPTDVSRAPRFRNRRHQSQRRLFSAHG